MTVQEPTPGIVLKWESTRELLIFTVHLMLLNKLLPFLLSLACMLRLPLKTTAKLPNQLLKPLLLPLKHNKQMNKHSLWYFGYLLIFCFTRLFVHEIAEWRFEYTTYSFMFIACCDSGTVASNFSTSLFLVKFKKDGCMLWCRSKQKGCRPISWNRFSTTNRPFKAGVSVCPFSISILTLLGQNTEDIVAWYWWQWQIHLLQASMSSFVFVAVSCHVQLTFTGSCYSCWRKEIIQCWNKKIYKGVQFVFNIFSWNIRCWGKMSNIPCNV